MNETKLTQISFGSFIKLNATIYLAIGILIGILTFLISLIGGDVTANLGNTEYEGIVAGIIGLFLSPIASSIIGAIFGIFAFFPFKLFLKFRKGINLIISTEKA